MCSFDTIRPVIAPQWLAPNAFYRATYEVKEDLSEWRLCLSALYGEIEIISIRCDEVLQSIRAPLSELYHKNDAYRLWRERVGNVLVVGSELCLDLRNLSKERVFLVGYLIGFA